MADINPVIKWVFLILMVYFINPFMCLDNYKKLASPDQISSKMTKASSTALEAI